MPMRVAVLGSGRGSNLEALLRHCEAGTVAARVTLVVSNKRSAGCLEIARKHDVPAVLALPKRKGESATEYDVRLLEVLQAEAPDLIVLAGYMRILSPAVVHAFEGRIINIHPSLLPAFAGASGAADAWAAGARIAGCTSHIVTAELDAGPMLLQAALAVRPNDNAEALARRILRLEHLVLPRTVQLWAEGAITIEGNKAHIAAPDSWLHHPEIEPVAGVLYSEGF